MPFGAFSKSTPKVTTKKRDTMAIGNQFLPESRQYGKLLYELMDFKGESIGWL